MLYGGAAGGGKSFWLRWYPIRKLIKWHKDTGIKGIRAGLFCEDYPALKDRHISKIKYEFPEWLGDFKDSLIDGLSFILKPDFGSGVLAFRNLDDVSKYQSSEFALEAVDELTKNKEEVFDFLRMRLRWPGITDVKFIAGTNPGDIGHAWVKKKWIDRDFDINEKEADQFCFIPAKVDDNPYLDQSYISSLDSLPENLRRAYRNGDWDVFKGQFFTEFSRDKHVVEPFAIPESWLKFRSIDPSGRDGITSCHWYVLDWNSRVFCYREHYGSGLDADQHAKEIARLSQGEVYRYTVIDSAAFSKLGLPETMAEIYIRCGVTGLTPASKDRVTGWNNVHTYLRWDENTNPKLFIFKNCENLIRTLPILIHDDLHVEDINTKGEDHAADELRYFLQTLREGFTPRPLTLVERRLKEIREQEESFNLKYHK